MYHYLYGERLVKIEYMVMALDVERDEHFYFAGESHDFWELVYVDQGEITATADGRVYNLRQGMLLFHKPMEFHRIYSGGQKSRLKIISFGASGSLMKQFENCCFDLNLAERERCGETADYFVKAYRASLRGDQDEFLYNFNIAAPMMESFLMMIRDKKEYRRSSISYSENMFYKIVELMKGNCENALSTAGLAGQLNMSVSNLKRIFSLYSDIGIAKYYMNLRIRHARELLEDGVPIAETAQRLGFRENYFCTAFRREVGMTPSQYIRSKAHPSADDAPLVLR